MASKTVIGGIIALALILLPEPITSATGTVLGVSILAGIFGVKGVI